jgi:phytoene synthase
MSSRGLRSTLPGARAPPNLDAMPQRTRPRVSALIGSSELRALADDAEKDDDNAGWVLALAPAARVAWLRRLRWVRVADRLAENERFEPEARRFSSFAEAFARLRTEGRIASGSDHEGTLLGVRALAVRALAGDRAAGRAVEACADYLDALRAHHRPSFAVTTLREHDEVLFRLSGRIFQILPFVGEALFDAAGEFGRLDQFMNDLRDLREDTENGICHFPAEILERFGVARGELISGRAVGGARHRRLMQYWLDERLPALRRRAAVFVSAEGLHPSLRVMRAWTLRRHARIERIFRASGFDHLRFVERYFRPRRRRSAS